MAGLALMHTDAASMAGAAGRSLLLALLQEPRSPWPASLDSTALDGLLALAQRERVEMLLAWRLLAGDSADLPAAVQALLARRLQQQTAVELLRQQALCEVLALLASHQLDCLVIKGSALAYSLYEQPCLRSRCDTDLWFRDQQAAEHAWRLLAAAGYQRLHTAGGDGISSQFPCTRTLAPGLVDMLDIHWSLAHYPAAQALSFDAVLAAALPVPALGAAARMPCLEHALLLACAHRLGHVVEAEENRLIWLYDIHLLCQHMDAPRWQALLALAGPAGLLASLASGIASTRACFAGALDPTLEGWLAAQPTLPANSTGVAGSVLQRDLDLLRQASGPAQRLRMLLQYLFPAADYMRHKYPGSPAWSLPCLYLWRAISGVGWRLRSHWRRRRQG